MIAFRSESCSHYLLQLKYFLLLFFFLVILMKNF